MPTGSSSRSPTGSTWRRDCYTQQRDWTEVQPKWINRIGSQLEPGIVVDRSAFDAEPFAAQGGWSRIDRFFNGKPKRVVRDNNEQVWKEAG
jgi:type I restriction enzyme R subunit